MSKNNRSLKFTMKNVRCFSGEQHFELRPLTFLVGENSTGKTTMMGCFSAIHHFLSPAEKFSRRSAFVDFNREPYSMGSFVNIARKSNEEKSQDKNYFELSFNHSEGQTQCYFHFEEREKGSEPVIEKMDIHHKNNKFSVNRNGKNFSYKGERFEVSISWKEGYLRDRGIFTLVPAYPSKHLHIGSCLWKDKILSQLPKIIQDPYDFLIYLFDEALISMGNNFESNDEDFTLKQEEKEDKKLLKQLQQKYKEDKKLLEKIQEEYERDLKYQKVRKKYRPPWDIFINIFDLAPIRSKPQRTYDPIIREHNSPQGTDIPVTLLQLSRNNFLWEKTYKQMLEFGKASGLFSDIEVKKFGETSGDPLQLWFKVRGFLSNIIDTGYGVSQILPILVHLSDHSKRVCSKRAYSYDNDKKKTWFLLQQPEVHLHPKAQAELASLFVHSTKTDNAFLIETHSDFMIDRARIEIRKGNIPPDHVSLIYLEAGEDGVKVHNISFDDQGNLLNTPKGYRDFFIKESNHFLGFED